MRRGSGQGLRRFSIGCTHGRTAVCGKLSGPGGAARDESAGRDCATKAWVEVMASKLALDPRVDPRIKAVFATFELPTPTRVASREELLAEEATNSATARAEGMKAFLDAMDTEEIAPSAGLDVRTERFTSSPDGNSVNTQFIWPAGGRSL